MKTYALGIYEKAMPPALSWKDKLVSARKIGYDFLEISIDESKEKLDRLDMDAKERVALVELMYQTQMPIRTMCLSGHRKFPLGSHDACIRSKSLEIMEKAIQLADDLGIRIIQLVGYDVYYEEPTPDTEKRFMENLLKVVNMAAKSGIVLGFETMETGFMDTVDKAMRYVTYVNSPYLTVYPDCGNLKNASLLYGNDIYQDLYRGIGHIAAIHLKESLPGKYREVPFGKGHVNFEKVIDTSWYMGIRRFVTEMWYTGSMYWFNEIQAAHDMMRIYLENKKLQ